MASGSQHSFVMFDDAWPAMSILTDEQRGRLIQALYAHHGFCEPVELDQATKAVLAALLPRMSANWKKYQEIRQKRADAARKRREQTDANASKSEQTPANVSKTEQTDANVSKAEQTPANASKREQTPANGTGYGYGVGSGYGSGSVSVSPTEIVHGEETPPYPPQGGSASREDSPPKSEQVELTPPEPKKPRKRTDYRWPDFDELWAKYPQHNAEARARKEWEKLAKAGHLPDRLTLLSAATWQASYWREQGRPIDKIPYLARWLNEKLWNDPQPEVQFKERSWASRASPGYHRPSPEEQAFQENQRNAAAAVASLLAQGYGKENGA